MKNKLLALGLAVLSQGALANLHLAPPDFDSTFGRAIFVDFTEAQYDITYDLQYRVTKVRTLIVFKAEKTGKPLFDLVPNPTKVFLNGEKVEQRATTLPNGSQVRLVDQEVAPGRHILEVEHFMSENTVYNQEYSYVSSAFWIRDLKDRMFLEQYVPSNFEYDQYKMSMDVRFKGRKYPSQEIFTNGEVTKNSESHYHIEFPDYFTVSCPFFHTTERNIMRKEHFTYKSVSGREIPMTTYSNYATQAKSFKKEAIRVMTELEADYGAWSHPSFLAYGTLPGTGGMEHAGATATSFQALDHEMLHSYFAKGVMPANGNSGWIDEAIASWRDKGYQRLPDPGFTGSDLGAHSVYKRNTDKRAYALGAAFMGYLDWRLQDMGGLKAFLKGYFNAYKHQVITAEHFKNNLEFFSGLDLDADFEKYVWGKNSQDTEDLMEENPHHKALDSKTLKSLL